MTEVSKLALKEIEKRYSTPLASLGAAHYKGDKKATTDLYLLCRQYQSDAVFLLAMIETLLDSQEEAE